jgi:hypothetical protein
MLLKGSHFHTDEALAKETGSRGEGLLNSCSNAAQQDLRGHTQKKGQTRQTSLFRFRISSLIDNDPAFWPSSMQV